MLKKQIIILFILAILFISPLSEAADLSLTDAVKLAEKNNKDLKIAEFEQQISELELIKTRAENNAAEINSESLKAEIRFFNNSENYRSKKSNIIKSVINDYLRLLSLAEEKKAEKLKLEVEARLLAEMEKRFQLKDINRRELTEQQNDYREKQIIVEDLENNYQLQKLNFKNELGLQNEIELESVKEINYWNIKETQILKSAFDNSFLLKIAESETKLAEIENKVSNIDAAEIDQKIAEISIEKAEKNYENEKEELENQIKAEYLTLTQAEAKIEVQKERKDRAENVYQQSLKEYDLGIITKTAVLETEAAFLTQKYQYLNSILDYYQAAEELAQTAGLEAGVILND
ncbi:Outer membrane efflux protein [Halanaerobium congolense]|jgi:hypothetical protein|uniref:Outer membrane efflux protein n=1 Tax=Halanaerobium congolense TaxID=54121 RepID=A0A1G8M1K7_9FIRM|nr:TolC family protein [Halanaerobium congolense]KXS49925.1 MAG: outer membrane protein [Halanaerobium sp. T82-1]TDX41786.1 outer membrane efflux protein [Halanaerobium congolense]SDI61775.1 Outer membrane efflux protein [Halanaerobium congolense]SET34198.1 Outer membrane efflux protein [Halanaerobium congolense]